MYESPEVKGYSYDRVRIYPDAQYQLHNSWLARFRKRMGWRDRNGSKPCPFCREPNPAATLTGGTAQITCRNCYAAGPAIAMEGPHRLVAAVLRWNKRPW